MRVIVKVKKKRPGASVPAAQEFDKKAPDSMFSHGVVEVGFVVVPSTNHCLPHDDDVFYLFLQKQKIPPHS
jgi:hypothetical protein